MKIQILKKTTTVIIAVLISFQAFSQTPVLSNTGVFCFGQIGYLWDPITDEQGNLFYYGQVRNNISLNGVDLGSSNHADTNDLICLKTNANHDVIWSKTFKMWQNSNFHKYAIYKGGMTIPLVSGLKGTYTIDNQSTIENDERYLIYALNIDSIGNPNLFPLIKQKDTSLRTFFVQLRLDYDNDTLVLTGTFKGAAWFGKNNVYIENTTGKENIFIARYTPDGEFLSIHFPYLADLLVNREILLEEGKIYHSFDFQDTLYPESGNAFPPVNVVQGLPLTWDAAVSCFNLRTNSTEWFEVFQARGEVELAKIINCNQEVGVYFSLGTTSLHLKDTQISLPLFSTALFLLNKQNSERKDLIILEKENQNTSGIFFNYESDTSVLISINNFGKHVKINANQFDFSENANESKTVFIRKSNNNIGYIGSVKGENANYVNSILFKNAFNKLTVMASFPSNADKVNIFGTDFTECQSASWGRIIANIDQLVSVEEVENHNLTVNAWPNPFIDKINIKTSDLGKTKFQVLNTNGGVCHFQEINSEENLVTLDLGFLANGVYYLVIENANAKVYKKIVKM